jgi:hypothetical protein
MMKGNLPQSLFVLFDTVSRRLRKHLEEVCKIRRSLWHCSDTSYIVEGQSLELLSTQQIANEVRGPFSRCNLNIRPHMSYLQIAFLGPSFGHPVPETQFGFNIRATSSSVRRCVPRFDEAITTSI